MIFRFPFILLASAGVVSILGRTIKLHPIVAEIARNFRDLTHPAWDRSLGLICSTIGFGLTPSGKDYLIVATTLLAVPFTILVAQHLWPRHATSYSDATETPDNVFIPMLSEVAFWVLLMVVMSSALIYWSG